MREPAGARLPAPAREERPQTLVRPDDDHPGRRRPARERARAGDRRQRRQPDPAPPGAAGDRAGRRRPSGSPRASAATCSAARAATASSSSATTASRCTVLASAAEHASATSDPAELAEPREGGCSPLAAGPARAPAGARARRRRSAASQAHAEHRRRSPTSRPPTSRSTSRRRSRFGLPWELLAAVGKVESDHGRDPGTDEPNAAGAVGPMQFEPATFAAYSWAAGSPAPNIDDPHDAIYAAAAMLPPTAPPTTPRAALYAYNHADWYVERGARLGGRLHERGRGRRPRRPPPPQRPPPPRGRLRARPARDAVPVGRRGPGRLRLLGLVQAAYAPAGSPSPRRAGPVRRRAARPAGSRSSRATSSSSAATEHVDHVGIVVNQSEMVERPTRALVRTEPFDWPDYLGATRPAG